MKSNCVIILNVFITESTKSLTSSSQPFVINNVEMNE